MPSNRTFLRASVALACAALVGALAVGAASAAKRSGGTINAAGSTFVQPLVDSWVNPVKSQLGLSLTYNGVGSGGGVQAITNKQVDLGMSDAPLSQFSPTCYTCIQIPWALAGTAAIYNLKGFQFLHITGSVLAQIFMGRITNWSNPAIQKLNKGVKLPNKAITVVHRSDSSGTSYNFTDYLSHVSKAWKNGPGTGTSPAWPAGVGASHSSGVAAAVKSTPGSISYVDVDYAVVNKLGYFKVQNRSGKFVSPRLNSILSAAQLDTHPAKDGSLSIVDPPKSKKYANAYPICTYTYVDVQKSTGNEGFIKKFLRWAITKGQSYGPKLFFVPLPDAVVAYDKKQISKIQ